MQSCSASIHVVISLFQFAQLEGLTCYDGEDLPDLYVKVGILSLNFQMTNILSYNENTLIQIRLNKHQGVFN